MEVDCSVEDVAPDNSLNLRNNEEVELLYDGDKVIVSGGSTARVELLSDHMVLKAPYPASPLRQTSLDEIEHEYRIYQQLGTHPRLLRVYAFRREEGLTMEYMPCGNLKDYLMRKDTVIDNAWRVQWIMDVLESISLLHAHDIVHGDIKAENFLLDRDCRLRVIDFSGSSTPGKPGSAMEGVRHCLPRSFEESSTIKTDLFAVGSTLYEIATGSAPYHDLDDEEVEILFSKRDFPDTEHLLCHRMIQACWRCEVSSINDLLVLGSSLASCTHGSCLDVNTSSKAY
ncbi:kinase-like domain-containing protein [Elsinoe ampelina]|uniref:Kinase-like domain-containing protein n=1 Tax=Elsinoe ampelina TaxID=302913 RepID=A0A6A6G3K1_9PEZI|nr:kinase-like domain-containing protein [Elsinoe ampelina]